MTRFKNAAEILTMAEKSWESLGIHSNTTKTLFIDGFSKGYMSAARELENKIYELEKKLELLTYKED